MALTANQRKLLDAARGMRLPADAEDIAAKAGVPVVLAGRELRAMEAGLTPRPVYRDLNANEGRNQWFLDADAVDDLLR